MRASEPDGFEELEKLPDDAIIEQDLKSAPARFYQPPAANSRPEEEIVELGPDVIVGEEHGAHRPQPRMPVLQEYSSVVIAEAYRTGDPNPQGERTIVVRDRRALQTNPARAAAFPQRGRRDRALVFSASIALAVVGTSFLMWLSSDRSSEEPVEAAPATAKRVTIEAERAESEQPEPPTVSVEELPIVHSQR